MISVVMFRFEGLDFGEVSVGWMFWSVIWRSVHAYAHLMVLVDNVAGVMVGE